MRLMIAAAVLPAVALLIYVYQKDRVEREPAGLLFLFAGGVVSAFAAMALEAAAQRLLNALVPPGTVLHTVLLAFFVVAAVEEGVKYAVLKRLTWNNPHFNYRFDAIVYAVFVSLGFAAIENVFYVFGYGLGVALPRALLSIPGHMTFGVYMGVYYGRARFRENWGRAAAARANRRMAYCAAVTLHGFYDACAMLGTRRATIVFLLFVLVAYTRMFLLLRRESAEDAPIL